MVASHVSDDKNKTEKVIDDSAAKSEPKKLDQLDSSEPEKLSPEPEKNSSTTTEKVSSPKLSHVDSLVTEKVPKAKKSTKPSQVDSAVFEKGSKDKKTASPKCSSPMVENSKKEGKVSVTKTKVKSPRNAPDPDIVVEPVSMDEKSKKPLLRKSLRKDSPLRSPKPDSPRSPRPPPSPRNSGNGNDQPEEDKRRLRRRSQTPDEVASDDGKR